MDIVEFDIERDTKNAVRYAERGDSGNHTIGTLYIKKSAFKNGEPFPTALRVTVEAA